MDTYNLNGITVAAILDNRRETKSGAYPVKIRVTYKRDRKYYSTGKNLSVSDWEKLDKTKNTELLCIKKDLQVTYEKVRDAVQSLENEGNFSFEVLNLRLGKGLTDTINIAFKAKLDTLMEEGSVGNALANRSAYKHLENYAGTNIPFEMVSADWLKKYEKVMIEEGKSYATISIYLRCLRAIFNDAKTAGTIKENQYPFGKGKYEIPIGKGRKMALNLQQIKQIITFSDGTEATEHYRDLWFFLYLCNGINVNDMLKLKFSNIDNDEVHFYRSKTLHTSREKKEIEALLTPEMKQIIERWGNPDKSLDNYVFPFLDGYHTPMEQKKRVQDVTRRINKHLKIIGDKLGISGVSTYTARHSYATVLKRSGANISYYFRKFGTFQLENDRKLFGFV
ncbi:MAG: site-specific integrase [Bacteroidales bacterium]|jgi:integrase|nr:site-specific integrase [Bacteroidales bacterium]